MCSSWMLSRFNTLLPHMSSVSLSINARCRQHASKRIKSRFGLLIISTVVQPCFSNNSLLIMFLLIRYQIWIESSSAILLNISDKCVPWRFDNISRHILSIALKYDSLADKLRQPWHAFICILPWKVFPWRRAEGINTHYSAVLLRADRKTVHSLLNYGVFYEKTKDLNHR